MSRNAFDLFEREYNAELEERDIHRQELADERAAKAKTVIKACPFCGHDDVEIDEIAMGIVAICCPECMAIGPHADGSHTVEQAIEKWNGRADQDARRYQYLRGKPGPLCDPTKMDAAIDLALGDFK